VYRYIFVIVNYTDGKKEIDREKKERRKGVWRGNTKIYQQTFLSNFLNDSKY